MKVRAADPCPEVQPLGAYIHPDQFDLPFDYEAYAAVDALPQMHNAPKTARTRQEDIALLEDLCETMRFGSLCALGGFTPYPVLSALKHWPEEFE